MTTQHAEVGQVSLRDDVAFQLNPSPSHYRSANRFLRESIPPTGIGSVARRVALHDPLGAYHVPHQKHANGEGLFYTPAGVVVSVNEKFTRTEPPNLLIGIHFGAHSSVFLFGLSLEVPI